MRKYTLPDGTTITWDGSLSEKIRLLDTLGITYVPTVEDLEEEADEQRIKDEYQDSITRLKQIRDFTGAATLTILGKAVKDIAGILLLLLRLLARQYR